MQLTLERRGQENTSEVVPGTGIMMTPIVNPDYWSYRVKLSDKQAVLGFPKFTTIGIGFADETNDWNVNLSYVRDTETIFQHIRENKGDESISNDDVRAAIALIQAAARQDRGES